MRGSVQNERLESVVVSLSREIEARVAGSANQLLTERDARKELVGCLLGSQVRSELAQNCTESLARAGMLDDEWWTVDYAPAFYPRILNLLSGLDSEVSSPRHRFYRLRACQLSYNRDHLAPIGLLTQLKSGAPAAAVRRGLVEGLAGIGPKQASMLIRNTGCSFELAILDIHVLRYLSLVGELSSPIYPSTLKQYEATEASLARYAKRLGIPLGLLDWAIWATMRAWSELSA